MTSGTQSKAQRRAESQRKAAERRAAELRAKRMRLAYRYGGAVVVIVVIVLVIVLGDRAPPNAHLTKTASDVKTVPIPASLQMVAAPPTTAGPRAFRFPSGPSWRR